MKSNVTITAGANLVFAGVTLAPGATLTLQPGASITANGVTIQNHSNLFDLVLGIIVDPTPCRPMGHDQYHDHDHDGSAPLMGVSEVNLVEAF